VAQVRVELRVQVDPLDHKEQQVQLDLLVSLVKLAVLEIKVILVPLDFPVVLARQEQLVNKDKQGLPATKEALEPLEHRAKLEI